LIANLAQTKAPAKLLIEKGIIAEAEFLAKVAEERPTSRENSSRFVRTLSFGSAGENVDSQRLERFLTTNQPDPGNKLMLLLH